MTLDDAITYYSDLANECQRKAHIESNDYMDLKDEAAECQQLAEWLNELKYLTVSRACAFYRANPHRFAKDYMNLNLRLFQKLLLFFMNWATNFLLIAARGLSKTFLANRDIIATYTGKIDRIMTGDNEADREGNGQDLYRGWHGMKGYKGTDRNVRCRGMQYEVGKSYHADGTIELCHNGLHFCRNLHDVFDFYDPDNGSRYFEVVASGAIQIGADKCAASDLTIVRELSKAEVNRCTYGDGNGNGYGDGDGNGYGYGYGDGYGYGCGYGYGYGYGYGDGYGYGYGYGYGDGDGYGYGCGYGYGYGDGYGNIQKILLWRTLS